MLASAATIGAVAKSLEEHNVQQVVIDPVNIPVYQCFEGGPSD
jgi:hydroxymethylpyrimidine/phosphomethylpyrimidine kinase